MTNCRSCGAAVIWAFTSEGKRIPLDAEPVRGGNIICVTDRNGRRLAIYRHRGDPPVEDMLARSPLSEGPFVSHFATCPDRDQWRKPREPVLTQEGSK